MENLPHNQLIINILFVLLIIVSCKNNTLSKEDTSQTIIKDDNICNKDYFLCKEYNDKTGIKHIIVNQEKIENEIYDAIEQETYIYSSLRLKIDLLLNNKQYLKVFDEVSDCQGTSHVDFLKKSLTITDINKNGIKEVTFLYDLTCDENIDPSKMKLIMIEGNKKYKIRGQKKFFIDSNGNILDEKLAFNIDKTFKSAPSGFLQFATKQWNNFLFDDQIGILNETRKKQMKKVITDIVEKSNSFQNNTSNKISTADKEFLNRNKLLGTYNYYIDAPEGTDIRNGISYNLNIEFDNYIFSKDSFRSAYKYSCKSRTRKDTLELYYQSTIEGDTYDKNSDQPLVKLYRKGKDYYAKSPTIWVDGEGNVEVKLEKEK